MCVHTDTIQLFCCAYCWCCLANMRDELQDASKLITSAFVHLFWFRLVLSSMYMPHSGSYIAYGVCASPSGLGMALGSEP